MNNSEQLRAISLAGNSDALLPSQKAAKTYVDAKVAALVNSSPALLDTLKELADAIGDDPNFAATMATALALKAPSVGGSLTALIKLGVRSIGTGAFDMVIANSENLTGERVLTVELFDGSKKLSLGGDVRFNAATIFAGITTGGLWYGYADGNAQNLAGNTTATKKFLTSTGTGSAAQAPVYSTVTVADVGGLGTGMAAALALAPGVASGLATLDGSGKLNTAQIPASLVGALNYQGTWNASTNTPALASGVGTKGFYYKVSVAGATSIDGIASWRAGDLIAFDGTVWDAIDGTTSEVISVAGLFGVVTAAGLKTALAIVVADISDFVAGIAAAIHNATGKNTPVDADEFGIADSAASYGLKKLTWANLKATLKTYLDTLYAPIGVASASYSPGVTSGTVGGTPATYTVNYAKHILAGKKCTVWTSVTVTNQGVGNSGSIVIDAPFTAATHHASGSSEDISTGESGRARIGVSGTTILCNRYDNATYIVTGKTVISTLTYEIA